LEPEAGSSVIFAEEPDLGSPTVAPTSAMSVGIGARVWKLPVKKEQKTKVLKDTSTVLSEFFENCNRRQKDLRIGGEEFVDCTKFCASPSASTNLRKLNFLFPLCPSVSSKKKNMTCLRPVPWLSWKGNYVIWTTAIRITTILLQTHAE